MFNVLPKVIDCGNPINKDAPLNQGLIFWWRSLGSESAKSVKDLISKETAIFNTNNSWGTAKKSINKAIIATGSSSQITFSTAINSKFTTDITVAAIYTPTDVASYHGICEENNQGGQFPFGLRTNPSAKAEMYGSTNSGTNNTTPSTTTLTNNTTYHLVGTVGSSLWTIYVNGIQESQNAGTGGTIGGSAVALNLLGAGGFFPGQGILEDLRIYNRNLTPSEVQALYITSKTGYKKELNFVERNFYPKPSVTSGTIGTATQLPKIINYGNPVNASSPLNRKLLLWATALPQRATSNRVIDLCGKRHFAFAGGLQWGGNRPNGFRCLDARNSTAMTSTSFKPPTNAFTTGIWFKTTTVSCGLIGFNGASDASSGTYDRSIYLDASGNAIFYVSGDIASTKVCNDNSWHFAVMTCSESGSNQVGYVDGVSVVSTAFGSGGFNGYSTPFLVVGKTAPSVRGFNYIQGFMADWFVYERELISSEVKDLYNSSRTYYRDQLNYINKPSGAIFGAAAAGGSTPTLFPRLLMNSRKVTKAVNRFYMPNTK